MVTRTFLTAFFALTTVTLLVLVSLPAHADGDFVVLDADRDGKLTRDEAGRQPRVTARFDQLDKDRDGSLSRPEFAALEIAEKRAAADHGTAVNDAEPKAPKRGLRQ